MFVPTLGASSRNIFPPMQFSGGREPRSHTEEKFTSRLIEITFICSGLDWNTSDLLTEQSE